MNVLPIIVGLLVGLIAPMLVAVATVAAKILSIGRDAVTGKKAPRKAAMTGTRAFTGAAVVKMPESNRDAEARRAA